MLSKTQYVIIGAGPAGLQLAYYFEQKNLDYLVLEQANAPGFFLKNFPRHGTLISINKVYTGCDDKEANLRWDWNSLLLRLPSRRALQIPTTRDNSVLAPMAKMAA